MKTKIAIALLAALPMMAMAVPSIDVYSADKAYSPTAKGKVQYTGMNGPCDNCVIGSAGPLAQLLTQFCAPGAASLVVVDNPTQVRTVVAVLYPGQNCLIFNPPLPIPKFSNLFCITGTRCDIYSIRLTK